MHLSVLGVLCDKQEMYVLSLGQFIAVRVKHEKGPGALTGSADSSAFCQEPSCEMLLKAERGIIAN